MKNKNLITISLPQEYHAKIAELGYTRKTLSEIIKERVDQDWHYMKMTPEEVQKTIEIARTPWIINDEDEY